jgi:hypothetical protein
MSGNQVFVLEARWVKRLNLSIQPKAEKMKITDASQTQKAHIPILAQRFGPSTRITKPHPVATRQKGNYNCSDMTSPSGASHSALTIDYVQSLVVGVASQEAVREPAEYSM